MDSTPNTPGNNPGDKPDFISPRVPHTKPPRELPIIEALISDRKHKLSYAREVKENERYYQDTKKHFESTIADLQAKLTQLVSIRADADALMNQYQDELNALFDERKLARNEKDIQKLIDLQRKFNEGQGNNNAQT